LTHVLINFQKKSKNREKQRKSKKYVLAFSMLSKKRIYIFVIFLIESTLILLVFKKYKKMKKNQIYKKKEVEGPSLEI